jgi:hypothetical protein
MIEIVDYIVLTSYVLGLLAISYLLFKSIKEKEK